MENFESVKGRYRLADDASTAGRYDDALTILAEIASELPNEPLFQWRIGYLLKDLNKPGDALEYFLRATRLDPNCWAAWGGLGQAYSDLGDWDRAAEAFAKRLKIRPGPHYYVFLSTVLCAKDDLDGAINACKRAIELDPTFDEAYFNLGVYYHLLKRDREATTAFEAALALDPSYKQRIEELCLKTGQRKRR